MLKSRIILYPALFKFKISYSFNISANCLFDHFSIIFKAGTNSLPFSVNKYSTLGGTMKSFLDRAFYVTSVNKGMLRHKVGAAVVAVRRAGGVPTFEQLNNYINYSEMLMPTSNYWNVINGTAPGEVKDDTEGNQIMRVLGKNMAWLMKLVEFGKGKVKEPEIEEKIFMNFIR
jgi:hypothetical protein